MIERLRRLQRSWQGVGHQRGHRTQTTKPGCVCGKGSNAAPARHLKINLRKGPGQGRNALAPVVPKRASFEGDGRGEG